MMSLWKAIFIFVIILVLGGMFFVYIIYGGLDKYKDPIQIIVPKSVNGILCIKLISNVELETSALQLKYWVQGNGYLEMNENLLISHRKKQFFRVINSTTPLIPIPDNEWFPIMTENDEKNGTSYMIYWLGTNAEWNNFANQQGNKSFCLSNRKKRIGDGAQLI